MRIGPSQYHTYSYIFTSRVFMSFLPNASFESPNSSQCLKSCSTANILKNCSQITQGPFRSSPVSIFLRNICSISMKRTSVLLKGHFHRAGICVKKYRALTLIKWLATLFYSFQKITANIPSNPTS